jgi:hypothetical protein
MRIKYIENKMQNLKINKTIYSAIISLMFVVLPSLASAESLTLKTAKTSYRVGDSFEVSVAVDAGANSINTISGKIKIPTDFFQISNLRYGNSIVTLWVEKPAIANGQVSFAGGIPGGFNSKTGKVLTFVLKAKKTGSVSITSADVGVLLNDGQGTPLAGLLTPELRLTIQEALPVASPPAKTEIPKPATPEPNVEVYIPPVDNVPPEGFIPLISQHPNIADNKYFVSFSAVDKDSGISYYEAKELPKFLPFLETDWEKTDGLYVLKNQLWMTKVIVRAYDQQGNYIDGEAFKSIDPNLAGLMAAVLVILLFYIRKLSTPKNAKSKGKGAKI